MDNLYTGQIEIGDGDKTITLEFHEHESRNAVLELIPANLRLNAAQLRQAAEGLEKQEAQLKMMRNRYASLAATALMFADESDGPPAPVDEDEEEEEEERWIGEILMEEGDLLDSKETDTGNPGSGDFVMQLYAYDGKYWLLDGINCWDEEFATYDEAHRALYNPEGNDE
jgi:hypothetical protein